MKRSILIILAVLLVPIFSKRVSASMTFTSPIYRSYLPIVAAPRTRYFAWSIEWDNRIPAQLLTLDMRQERQYSCSAQEAAQFASIHPGQLYIACDEPDINTAIWPTQRDYAVWYHGYVATVLAADPTARFSPAGIAWLPGFHFVDYAQAFYSAYISLYSTPPIVHEWRFHVGVFSVDGFDAWSAAMNEAAEWSVSHGAQMTLGSFGAQSIPRDVDISSLMLRMRDYINSDPRVVSAAWWSMDWQQWNHALELPDGNLSAEGKLYSKWR